MEAPDFWDDQESAGLVVAELKSLKAMIDPVEEVLAGLGDVEILLELEREGDNSAAEEARSELERLKNLTERVELMTLLSGPDDRRNCYFSIQAGAGGTEACAWAEMLLRMYLYYFEQAGFKVKEVSQRKGEGAGIQSAELEIRGPYAYGYLSCEAGVHRMQRVSPFNAQGKRQTSFAAVDVIPEMDEIAVDIDWDADVRDDTYRASGKGGQHVNKTESAVRLTHFPTGLVVQCQNERSQHQNRARARKVLVARLHQLERAERDKEMAKLYGDKGQIGWGYRIRTYTLRPYLQIRDERGSGYQTPDVDGVLNGDLQPFIDAELRRRTKCRTL